MKPSTSRKFKKAFFYTLGIAISFFLLNHFLDKKWLSALILSAALILITFIRVKVRGYFWKLESGEELNFKGFLKQWGKGIEGITPYQQAKSKMLGTIITLSGIIMGFTITLILAIFGNFESNVTFIDIILKRPIWVCVVLAGSLILTIIMMISTYQEYKIKQRIDRAMKEAMGEEDG